MYVSDGFCKHVALAESSNNPYAKNPNSSALGLYQFIAGTWLAMLKTYFPELHDSHTHKFLLNLRTDREFSTKMFKLLVMENVRYLENKGIVPTDGGLYLCHFLGPFYASKVLDATADTLLDEVLPSWALHSNPYLRGKSVDWLKEWASQKVGV